MNTKVLSFKEAIEKGYNPRNYSHEQKDMSEGAYHAVLDFKIWAHGNIPAVTCFFTLLSDNKKFKINIFRDKDEKYIPQDSNVDLTDCPIETEYIFILHKNRNGKMKVYSFNLKKNS